jgi:hypothetical protein
MTIDRDGHAIICGEMVRKHGVIVLRAACTLPGKFTVPQLARKLGGQYSESHLYTTIGRLHSKQGLFTREDARIAVLDITVRRILWEPTQCVRDFFKTEELGARS